MLSDKAADGTSLNPFVSHLCPRVSYDFCPGGSRRISDLQCVQVVNFFGCPLFQGAVVLQHDHAQHLQTRVKRHQAPELPQLHLVNRRVGEPQAVHLPERLRHPVCAAVVSQGNLLLERRLGKAGSLEVPK